MCVWDEEGGGKTEAAEKATGAPEAGQSTLPQKPAAEARPGAMEMPHSAQTSKHAGKVSYKERFQPALILRAQEVVLFLKAPISAFHYHTFYNRITIKKKGVSVIFKDKSKSSYTSQIRIKNLFGYRVA